MPAREKPWSRIHVRVFLIPAALALASSHAAAAVASGKQALIPPGALESKWNPAKLTFPPLGSIPKVEAERVQLPNGLVIYLVQDTDYPDLSGNALIHAGTMYDPTGKEGLGRLASTILRTGGSTRISGDSLDARLEAIGSTIETGADETSASVSFYSLTDYGDEVLGDLADLLQHPAFPQVKLDLAKVSMRRQIAARNDEPGAVGRRVLRQIIWGKESPYAREPEIPTVESVTTEDLKGFYDRYYVPNQTILTISGDFEPSVMKNKLTELFGGWPRSEEPLPPPPPVPADESGGVYYAERPDMTQSYVYLAQIGIKADSPDVPAMDVMAELLGGGFSSRIVNDIRTARGLAYAAGASSGVGYAHPGIFVAYALTRIDSTLVTLGLLRDEVREIVSSAPSEEEVRRARESLLNSFVFNFQTKGQVANRGAFYEFYGYPADYLTAYQEGLRKVSAEDVLRVARAHLNPEGMSVLIVGNQAAFAKPLSTLGPYTTVDLSIPGLGGGSR
jgi:zinc protease